MNSSTSSRASSDLNELLKKENLHVEDENENEVCWDESNKDHPRNWGFWSKFYTAVVISWLELFMTGISSSGTAAATSAYIEYGISETLAYFAFVTIYLLGQTIGGIFCSPISETFGRRTIYIIASIMFCIFSAIVAAVPSSIAVYFGRFFQGIAAAIPATVAFGNFNDMYDSDSRIWVVYLYTLAGMIGLVLGPIYSAYITEILGWRWVFYISTIVAFVSTIACFFVKESNSTQLLQAKVNHLKQETGNDQLYASGSDTKLTLKSFARDSLFRPLLFLVTEPIIALCAILCAIAFGLIYGLTEGLTILYTTPPFNKTFNTTTSSLTFLPILLGILLNFLPRISDSLHLRRLRARGIRILPESKLSSFAISGPALPLGLWLLAWTIPPLVPDVPFPVSFLGLILVGFSLNDFSYVLFGYVTDAYGEYAASAVAAVSLSRTLTAAVFPLFAEQMFSGLGGNVAVSILAGVATGFGVVGPVVLIKYGGALRRRSKVACGDEDALVEENGHLGGEGGERKKKEKVKEKGGGEDGHEEGNEV